MTEAHTLLGTELNEFGSAAGPVANDTVAVTVVDNAGIHRMKGIPGHGWASAVERGAGMGPTVAVFTASGGMATIEGVSNAIGDIRLRPDAAMVRRLPQNPGWWWAPADMYDQEGNRFSGCARNFLRRMVDRADAAGLQLLTAFELEWWVGHFDPVSEQWLPVHRGPGYGAHMPFAVLSQLHDIAADLLAVDCPPGQVHPEWADGQLEVSLPPRDPMRAADEVVLARTVIKRQAELHGMAASFAAMSSLSQAGNGAHAHFSLHTAERSLMAGGDGPHGLQRVAEHFGAGVLAHLPALTALGSPTPLSYERLRPSAWASTYTCWGRENREAALRLEGVQGSRAGSTANVEWKAVDGSANPYQVLGGVIAAGLDGVARGLKLPAETLVDPATMTIEQRALSGIGKLPASLDEAADALRDDDVLREAMGAGLHDRIVAVRRADADASRELSPADLLTRYRSIH